LQLGVPKVLDPSAAGAGEHILTRSQVTG
jgi:hypothetical protein